MRIQILTAAEEQLMLLLWELNSFYLRDVMEKHAEPKPHQNTVSTYLNILAEKGFLAKNREGRIFKYEISVNKDDYRIFLVKKLVEKYFISDGKKLLACLIENNFLTTLDVLSNVDLKVELKETEVQRNYSIADSILDEKDIKIKKNSDKKKKNKKGKKK